VVAEGIEDVATLDLLSELDCDVAQVTSSVDHARTQTVLQQKVAAPVGVHLALSRHRSSTSGPTFKGRLRVA